MSVQVLWDEDAETKSKVQEIYYGGSVRARRSWSQRERDSDYGCRSDTRNGRQRRKGTNVQLWENLGQADGEPQSKDAQKKVPGTSRMAQL